MACKEQKGEGSKEGQLLGVHRRWSVEYGPRNPVALCKHHPTHSSVALRTPPRSFIGPFLSSYPSTTHHTLHAPKSMSRRVSVPRPHRYPTPNPPHPANPSHTSCTGSSHTTSPLLPSLSLRNSIRDETIPPKSPPRNDPPDKRFPFDTLLLLLPSHPPLVLLTADTRFAALDRLYNMHQ